MVCTFLQQTGAMEFSTRVPFCFALLRRGVTPCWSLVDRVVSGDSTGIPPKVMVIDDDASIRAILRYRFEREHCVVQLANNGLVVPDLTMPGMDGIQFLLHLRDNPQTESIPVIILTALEPNPCVDTIREMRATGLVLKPSSPRRLVEEAKEALDCVRVTYGRAGSRGFGPGIEPETGET